MAFRPQIIMRPGSEEGSANHYQVNTIEPGGLLREVEGRGLTVSLACPSTKEVISDGGSKNLSIHPFDIHATQLSK